MRQPGLHGRKHGNSLLSTEDRGELDRRGSARMNRDRTFMMFMRKNYPAIGKTSATSVQTDGVGSDSDDSDADY